MKVRLKLFATFDRYLPEGARGRECEMDVPGGTTAHALLAGLGVPVGGRGEAVVLLNGRHCTPGDVLSEGDVVSAFPAMAGG